MFIKHAVGKIIKVLKGDEEPKEEVVKEALKKAENVKQNGNNSELVENSKN